MKKTRSYGYVYEFFVHYESNNYADDTFVIHNYLIKKHGIKSCSDLLKNVCCIIEHNFW